MVVCDLLVAPTFDNEALSIKSSILGLLAQSDQNLHCFNGPDDFSLLQWHAKNTLYTVYADLNHEKRITPFKYPPSYGFIHSNQLGWLFSCGRMIHTTNITMNYKMILALKQCYDISNCIKNRVKWIWIKSIILYIWINCIMYYLFHTSGLKNHVNLKTIMLIGPQLLELCFATRYMITQKLFQTILTTIGFDVWYDFFTTN